MSTELMQKAKALILAHRYDEARKLLHTINTPESAKWLVKLNQIAPPPTSPVKAISSTDDLFKQAKMLMKNRQFDEARHILQKIEHPMATKWLAKLNQVAPSSPPMLQIQPSTKPPPKKVHSSNKNISPERLLEEAKELMKARQFDKARHILEALKHPTAALWLLKLNEIAPPPPSFDIISDKPTSEPSAFDFIPDEPTSEPSAFDFIPDEPPSEPSAFDFIPDEPPSEPSAFDFILDEPVSEPPAFDFNPDEPASEPSPFDFISDEPISEPATKPDFHFNFDEEPSESSFDFGGEETLSQPVLAIVEDDVLPIPDIEDVLGETYQANLAVVSEEPLFDEISTAPVDNLPSYTHVNNSAKSGSRTMAKKGVIMQLTNADGTFNKGRIMLLLGGMGAFFGICTGFLLDSLGTNVPIFCCSLSFFGLIAGVGLGYLADWDKFFATWNNYMENPENLIDDIAEALETDEDDIKAMFDEDDDYEEYDEDE